MIAFPNAKINLGLKVLEKRTDGFHNIETIFYPIGLSDVLEIIPSGKDAVSFSSTGLTIPGSEQSNLCLKAYHLVSSIFHLPPVSIHLHKVIPIGAGLGGGSSDGAFTIKILNDLFLLKLTNDQLMDYARQLGSDCAFFIENKPLYAFEKGDQFEQVEVDLSSFHIEITTSLIHINTAEAYAMMNAQKQSKEMTLSLKDILKRPVEKWKDLLINDFELPVFNKYPELEKMKNYLYKRGAVYVSMTGSGSSLYGLFSIK
jgi:4-diphosphocytidyl-2-C-methyl-D-erythritol kinase